MDQTEELEKGAYPPQERHDALEAERVFRTMADNAPVLMWMAGADGARDYFNEGWLRFSGRTLLQEAGNGWTQGIHPDDLQHSLQALAAAFERRDPFETEYRLRRYDGVYRWMLDRGAPFYRSDESFAGYVGACLDVTERREDRQRIAQNEAELQRLNAELEQRVGQRTAELAAANKELESFTYSVSHDLRAPIRSIIGYANILIEDYDDQIDSDGQKMLHRQVDAAKRMEKLIGDLLDYCRLGRQEIARVDFDLSRLAQEVADEICNRRLGCEVRFDIAPGFRVYADPVLIRYVIQNLFENSVKYSEPTGQARVKFGRTDDGAFFVQDNGVGFDMRYADKLFQPFERLHSSSQFPGTGIGLANVHRIIQRHGGQIWAEAEVDKGATFYFTLGNSTVEGPALADGG